MRRFRFSILACALVALFAVATQTQADISNKKTIVTLRDTLQIQGTVLAPGTYVFKLEDSQADRHIVRIMNDDETRVVATLIASPTYRLSPRGETTFEFHELPSGTTNAAALHRWFYPGDNYGQAFREPEVQPAQVVQAQEEQVTQVAQAEPPPAPMEQPKAEEPVAEPQAPAAEPAPAPEPAPEPEPAPMPRTASPLPLVALTGLFSLAIGFALRLVRS
jgi:hypothetical protein